MTPNAAEKGPLVLRTPVKRKGRHALQTAGRANGFGPDRHQTYVLRINGFTAG